MCVCLRLCVCVCKASLSRISSGVCHGAKGLEETLVRERRLEERREKTGEESSSPTDNRQQATDTTHYLPAALN